ncbi:hypothetical protein HDU67_010111, partial [Dinochytrium kinnereticum]
MEHEEQVGCDHQEHGTTTTTTTTVVENAELERPAGPPTSTETTTVTRQDGATVTTLVETFPDRIIRTITTLSTVDGVENESIEIEEEIFETEVVVIEHDHKHVKKVGSRSAVVVEEEREGQAKEAAFVAVPPAADGYISETILKGTQTNAVITTVLEDEEISKPVGAPIKSETSSVTREDGTTVTTLVETYDDRVIRTTTTVTVVDGVENESVEIEEEIYETEVIV